MICVEQLQKLQKIKAKFEIALEKHQDSFMWKFKEQNYIFQTNGAEMAEGLALALTRKDQEWSEKNGSAQKEETLFDR